MSNFTTFKRYLCIKSLYDLDGSLLLEERNVYWLSDKRINDNVILLLSDSGKIEEYPNFDNAFVFRFKLIV